MKLSVVVEWETVLEGKEARGVASLRSLRAQVAQLPGCETIICFDPEETTATAVRAAAGDEWPGALVVEPAPARLDYYGKKNYGFTLTSGDVVVFLDSDLITEDDWLQNLTAPFDDFRVSLVVGRTHLETTTLYERAVALFWIFDARDPSSSLRPTSRLVSNNVAFRRTLFTHFPFPDRPTFRGQCSELASTLEARRIAMYEQPSARASHPAPDGMRRFFSRAWRAGHDHSFYDALAGSRSRSKLLDNWRKDVRHVRQRIIERAPLIGARAFDKLAARSLGSMYYATKALSSLWSMASEARALNGRSDLSDGRS